jgi:hypothetical protein
MDKTKLSDKEKEVYEKIIKYGTMEDMFDLAHAIGRASIAQEQLDNLKQYE